MVMILGGTYGNKLEQGKRILIGHRRKSNEVIAYRASVEFEKLYFSDNFQSYYAKMEYTTIPMRQD